MNLSNPFDAPFWAEVFITAPQKNRYNKKLEQGFETLEEAKTWVKKHALSPRTACWFISEGETIILKGE